MDNKKLSSKRSETHLLIIWSKALIEKPRIIKDISRYFEVKRVVNINWEKDNFLKNLKRFYCHSQKNLNNDDFEELLLNKIRKCGSDPFCAVIFEDYSPNYDLRKTSSGLREVNTNIFDLKKSLRTIFNGESLIHATDNPFESNKDLTVLFGKNTIEHNLIYKVGHDIEEETYNNNTLGFDGFKSLKELFYLLNNTIEYCVIRNYECFPDSYNVEGHGDIDLLVEDLNYVIYLTDATPVYPELEYRVHYNILINNELIPFDFRYLGDRYYDLTWQQTILKTRIIHEKMTYVPNQENYFWSLLYHALIQKKEYKKDYIERLTKISKKIGLSFNLSDEDICILKLKEFMISNNYIFELPIDLTVYFKANPVFEINTLTDKYGELISNNSIRLNGRIIRTTVYKKDRVITKISSKEIINNEKEFLKRLNNYSFFPKYISDGIIDEDRYFVRYSFIQNECTFDEINILSKYFTKENIKLLLANMLEILTILLNEDISHRDVRPMNILIRREENKLKPFLIDFGCSSNLNNKKARITPPRLGSRFKYNEGDFSDIYSLGKSFQHQLGYLHFVNEFSKELVKITPNDYENVNVLNERILRLIEINKSLKPNIKDKLWLFLKRNPFFFKLMRKIKFN